MSDDAIKLKNIAKLLNNDFGGGEEHWRKILMDGYLQITRKDLEKTLAIDLPWFELLQEGENNG